ncbi:MAG: hypothetical protein SFW35_11005 [Chitinophagales bacterium]|nr:hypothetical protein [Chitinophagales bacterium]
MTIEKIKQLLHEGIENIDDKDFLLMIQEIVEHKHISYKEPILSMEQLKRIQQGKDDFKKGIFITNEDADRLIDQWLKEK